MSTMNSRVFQNVGGSAVPMLGGKLKTHHRKTTGILRNVTQDLENILSHYRREQGDQPAIIRFSGRTLLQEVI
jgi:hypothetical protein